MMELEIYYPVLDDKNKIANIAIQKQKITDTKITFIGKSKAAFLVVENLSHSVELLHIGNKIVEIGQGLSAVNVTDVENVEFSKVFDGYIYAIGEWSRILEKNKTTIYTRLRRGWTVERALGENIHEKGEKRCKNTL